MNSEQYKQQVSGSVAKKGTPVFVLGVILFGAMGVLAVVAQGYTHISELIGFKKLVVTAPQDTELQKFSDRERRTITVGEHKLEVEVVTSAESTTQGLSGRESIGADGMLFVFPEKQVHRFWMPDMQFDLDMVWITDDTVVGVTAKVPKPTENQVVLPTYSSNVPVNRVLELPAGKAHELSIEPGTTIIY